MQPGCRFVKAPDAVLVLIPLGFCRGQEKRSVFSLLMAMSFRSWVYMAHCIAAGSWAASGLVDLSVLVFFYVGR